MNGPIRRLPRERVESRSEARLPTAWINGATGGVAPAGGAWLSRGGAPGPGSGEGPVLVMLGSESGGAQAELVRLALAGARVYLLTAQKSPGLPFPELPRVLARRVPEVPVSAVLAGAHARVWFGGGLALRLDAGQAEALRQTFLRLFWHEAEEEAWSEGRQLNWRPALERPFDVPELPRSASLRREAPDARLIGDARGALLHLRGGEPPEASPRRLWFPAGPEHHERLARHVRAGAEVLWADRDLPDLLLAKGAGEMLLPGLRGRLRIHLTAEQAGELAPLLEAGASWRFRTEVRLGDPEHRGAQLWLPGEGAPRGLEAEQELSLPDLHAGALREVPDTAPAKLPPPQVLALSARYSWVVVPPRLPAGAAEDALVGRWGQLNASWCRRLTQLNEALSAAEDERGRIGRALSRLASAMLGYQHTHGGLRSEAAALAGELPSKAGPAGAPGLLTRLAELEEAAQRLRSDLEEAERKGREQEEREEQRAAWSARVAGAERQLPGLRAALSQLERGKVETQAALSEVEESLKAAEEPAEKGARADASARRKKLSDELSRANKALEQARSKLEAAEQKVAEQFDYRPTTAQLARAAAPGGRFVPAPRPQRPAEQVPEEALPEVGALFSQKDQRYLVIRNWEELAAGEQAASRLSAKLVAPEDL